MNNPSSDFDKLNMMLEELFERLTLTDGDGNDIEFELLDLLDIDRRTYIVLQPEELAQSRQVVLMRVEGEGLAEHYIGLEDAVEAQRVFEAFQERVRNGSALVRLPWPRKRRR